MPESRSVLLDQQALEALKQGQNRVALRLYDTMLEEQEGSPALIHLQISSIYESLADDEQRDTHLLKAIASDASHPRVLLANGAFLFRRGDINGARQCFREAVAHPEISSQALSNLAVVSAAQHLSEEAHTQIQQALLLDPNNTHALDVLVRWNLKTDSNNTAIEAFASQLDRTDQELLWTALGKFLVECGRLKDALSCFERARRLDWSSLEPLRWQARLLIDLGRSDEAAELLLVCLVEHSGNVDLLLLMGYAMQDMKRVAEAEFFYRQILEIEGVHSRASNLLGCCCRSTGREEESIQIFRAALHDSPHDQSLLGNLAGALRSVGRVDESLAVSRRALADAPLVKEHFYSYMFTLSALSGDYLHEALRAGASYWNLYRQDLLARDASWNELDPVCHRRARLVADVDGRPIKIGVLSAEIGAHVVGMFLRSFLTHYDRQQLSVTLIVANRRYEAQEQELFELADDVLSIHGLPDIEAARSIAAQRFDLIVETSGYTQSTQIRLLAFRLAPVQCHYIGYHASTALDTIDYFIGDPVFTPPQLDGSFSEKVWRLPSTWIAISHHEQPPIARSQATTDQLTFGSFNQAAKFTAETFDYWAHALCAVPGSIILVKDRSLSDPVRRDRISGALVQRGVSASRVHFMGATSSIQDHLDVYNAVDVCLDCTLWSGSTTVFDSLSMGTPYIAIKRNTASSRMSSSILEGFGKSHWIASNLQEFGEIASAMALLKAEIRARKPELQREIQAASRTKAVDIARHLSEAFGSMVKGASCGK